MRAEKVILRFFAALVILALFAMSVPLWAQECRGHSCNDADGTIVDTNLSTSISDDNLALGFGGASFDVDIGDCMGSQSDQYLFGLWGKQRMRENYWCHAMTLIQAGYVEAGSFMLCNHTILAQMPDCPGNLFEQPETASNGPSQTNSVTTKELEERIEQQQMELQTLANRYENMMRRPTVIREQSFLTAEKRQALEALRDE